MFIKSTGMSESWRYSPPCPQMRSVVQNGWDQLSCFRPLFPFGEKVQIMS